MGFNGRDSINLDAINLEITTNYTSQLALTKAFLPFFQKKGINGKDSALIYVTSGLALVPIARCSNYCASKAAMHQLILCLREQLKNSNIKVVELYPLAVQTELHDEKQQPDIKNGGQIGMPLDEFVQEVRSYPVDSTRTLPIVRAGVRWFVQRQEQVPVGTAERAFEAFGVKRQEIFAHMVKATGGGP